MFCKGTGMEESAKSKAHLTSAAALVEGGIQYTCDDDGGGGIQWLKYLGV